MIDKKILDELAEHTKELKLLYVEDDENARSSTLKILSRFFKDIFLASDGVEGYEIFKKGGIDIVISDINMPNENGIDMCRKIREDESEIPLLLLSAYNDSEYFIDAIKIGIDCYLLKPIDIEQFLEATAKAVDRIVLKRELDDYKTHLEQKVQSQTQVIKESYYKDFLTSLPNQAKLKEEFEKSNKKAGHLILLDIVNFSAINKEYGKLFANEVIISISKELPKLLKDGMKLFRGDSDCFLISLDIDEKEKVVEFSKSILEHFDHTYIDVVGSDIKVNFSIGISRSEESFFDTLVHLDYALDFSKKIGKRHYEYYEEDSKILKEETEMIKWLSRTKQMIDNDGVIPYFQPIADLKTDKIVKFEILTRGLYEGEIYTPNYFMDAAMRQGIISCITKSVIAKSFPFFKDNDYTFSINITLRDLEEDYLYDYVKEKLDEHGIDPARFSFEILEDITIDPNKAHLIEQINSFKSLGCKISIDDFGIENSNFSRLFAFEADFLKLDGIFIRDILQGEKNKLVTTAIVKLSKLLNIKVVAEYVENKEIYEYLKDSGLDYAQGYFIGQPKDHLVDEIDGNI
jgi:diguanylate cyclase (GGDEF)-like protein